MKEIKSCWYMGVCKLNTQNILKVPHQNRSSQVKKGNGDVKLNDCILSSCSPFNFYKMTPLFKILGSASLIHLPRLLLFDQKYSNIVKYYNLKQLFSILIYLNIVLNLMMAKLHFQHHYFSLQCDVILQKSFTLVNI